MIRASMFVTKPEEAEVTLKITMPLKKWSELKTQIESEKWPALEFRSVLSKAIYAIEQAHMVEQDISQP